MACAVFDERADKSSTAKIVELKNMMLPYILIDTATTPAVIDKDALAAPLNPKANIYYFKFNLEIG